MNQLPNNTPLTPQKASLFGKTGIGANHNFDLEVIHANHATSAEEVENDIYYYHTDHLGSSSWIAYTDGSVTQHLQSLPFGEPFIDQRATSYDVRFKFTGKEMDTETGYQFPIAIGIGARYYNSGISVWLSVDPLAVIYPHNSPYNYVSNHPINYIDKDGNAIVPILDDPLFHYLNSFGNEYYKLFKLKLKANDQGSMIYYSKSNMSEKKFKKRAGSKFGLEGQKLDESWKLYKMLKSKSAFELLVIDKTLEMVFSKEEIENFPNTQNDGYSKAIYYNRSMMDIALDNTKYTSLEDGFKKNSDINSNNAYFFNNLNKNTSYSINNKKFELKGLIVIFQRDNKHEVDANISESFPIIIDKIMPDLMSEDGNK